MIHCYFCEQTCVLVSIGFVGCWCLGAISKMMLTVRRGDGGKRIQE
jgi:hypothetical protein